HPRHVDVAQHHVDGSVLLQHSQSVHAVAGEHEAECSRADFPAESLQNQQFEIGLVVDDEDPCVHPLPRTSAITPETSRFNCGKSTGLVMNLLAPRSSAVRTRSASP